MEWLTTPLFRDINAPLLVQEGLFSQNVPRNVRGISSSTAALVKPSQLLTDAVDHPWPIAGTGLAGRAAPMDTRGWSRFSAIQRQSAR